MFGKRFSRALAVATAMTLIMTSVALADTVNNNVQSEYGSENVPYTAGAAAVPVKYWIENTSAGGNANCDVSTANPGTVALSVPAGVTASSTSFQLSACGETAGVSISFSTAANQAAGKYTISIASVTNTGTQGNYNLNNAQFHLQVSAPGTTNAQPQVAADQASVTVNEGTQATNTGTWSDANGDNVSLTASLGLVSKNSDGTWSWSHTSGDNMSATTVTITADDGTGTANATNTATFSLTVNNVAPSKTADSFSFNPYTGLASASVSFSDPGWLDIVTANWSNITNTGTNPQGPRSGTGTAALTGTFTASQTYTGCIADAISVRVSDDDGGYFDHEFAAADTLGVRTAEFKAPIKAGTRNVAKLGNVIPVKLEVRDCRGALVSGLNLSIRLIKGDTTDENEVGSVVIDATSVSSADTTNLMREQDSFYMYNLATKGLATGTPFTIVVKDGTQIVASALIELKK